MFSGFTWPWVSVSREPLNTLRSWLDWTEPYTMETETLNSRQFQLGQSDKGCFLSSLNPGRSWFLLFVVRKRKGKITNRSASSGFMERAKRGSQKNRNIPKLFSLQLKFLVDVHRLTFLRELQRRRLSSGIYSLQCLPLVLETRESWDPVTFTKTFQ